MCECYLRAPSSRCAFALLVFSRCFSRVSPRFRRMWAARDFKGRPGWSSRRGMVGWSTGQPCLEGGFNPFVMDTPRMRSPFALLTPGVRRILNQSRVSSSARAVVMMSKMGTRRMAALCWGGAAPGPGSAWLSGSGSSALQMLSTAKRASSWLSGAASGWWQRCVCFCRETRFVTI